MTVIVIMSTKVVDEHDILEIVKLKDKVSLAEDANEHLALKATWTNILDTSKSAKKLMKKLVIYPSVLLVKKEQESKVNCLQFSFKEIVFETVSR